MLLQYMFNNFAHTRGWPLPPEEDCMIFLKRAKIHAFTVMCSLQTKYIISVLIIIRNRRKKTYKNFFFTKVSIFIDFLTEVNRRNYIFTNLVKKILVSCHVTYIYCDTRNFRKLCLLFAFILNLKANCGCLERI